MHALLARPGALLIFTFAGLIVLGTAALELPAASAGPRVGLLNSFFTATSAVCVTGLITVDTATAWSRFGQTVILILIQLGAIGIMTFAALIAEVLRLRLSTSSRLTLEASFVHREARETLRSAVFHIALITVILEALGALLLHRALLRDHTAAGGVFEAIFLSISAFCNAGFSVYSDSVMRLAHSPLAYVALLALITLGGLGYPVLHEVLSRTWRAVRRKPPVSVRWSLHTRIVVTSSAALVTLGALALALTGVGPAKDSFADRVVHGLFQSVSARTAGFNSVDIGALPLASLLWIVPLMFIGGSPGSCAGGVKTTTATVWLARIWARLRESGTVPIGGRRIPIDLVRRCTLLVAVAMIWNVIGVMLLVISERGHPDLRLEAIVFEQISAFGTVGLSAGITPELSAFGKLWIAATMFLGRVGPLTIALVVVKPRRSLYEYPEERVLLG